MGNDIFPWQTHPWQQLLACKQQGRLPHALLFVGAQGLGKKQFTESFVNVVLCNESAGPCGQCRHCHLLQTKSHPDLMWIMPEKTGQMIKVDQIREAVQFSHETALQGGYRIIVISPADAMNINAANALLKTLEEPSPHVLIILICDYSVRLPLTIKSRCQQIIFQKPKQDIALAWLKQYLNENDEKLQLFLNLAGGSPLKAIEYANKEEGSWFAQRQIFYQGLDLLTQRKASPLQLAAQLQEYDLLVLLNLLLSLLHDMLRYKMTQGEMTFLINSDYLHVISRTAVIFSNDHLLSFVEHVRKIHGFLQNSLNLNRLLLLEELFILWGRYASC